MRTLVVPSFDRTGMLNDIKAGYYRAEMSVRPEDPKTLEREQDERARAEERFAREADQPAEQRAHERRADKAAYLRDKLAEADAADRAAGEADAE